MGEFDNGHYVNYSYRNNEWMMYNDTLLQKTEVNKIKCPYLLFY